MVETESVPLLPANASKAWLFAKLSSEQIDQLHMAERFLHMCQIPEEHTYQSACLALALLDCLQPLLNEEPSARFLLASAAVLHDVGLVEGHKNHHKRSLNMILETPLLNFDAKDRLLIGSIARYHRKALPSIEHDHFLALDPESRETVKALAAILRLADALDASHRSRVSEVNCKIGKKKIKIMCKGEGKIEQELESAYRRRDLLEEVLGKKVWVSVV